MVTSFPLISLPQRRSGFLDDRVGRAKAVHTAGLAGINDAFGAAEMPCATATFSMLWYVGGLTARSTVLESFAESHSKQNPTSSRLANAAFQYVAHAQFATDPASRPRAVPCT